MSRQFLIRLKSKKMLQDTLNFLHLLAMRLTQIQKQKKGSLKEKSWKILPAISGKERNKTEWFHRKVLNWETRATSNEYFLIDSFVFFLSNLMSIYLFNICSICFLFTSICKYYNFMKLAYIIRYESLFSFHFIWF